MAVYRTTLPIAASAGTVWEILTDFERYPEWNPSLPSIDGELRAGSPVALTPGMPGTPSPRVKAKFGEVAPGRRLTSESPSGRTCVGNVAMSTLLLLFDGAAATA
jgi:uncharacterized protein YndB with AHSA1/START domain